MIGSPGTQTQASFDGVNHTYADNGVYTVTLRVADDDMAAYNDATKFTSGTLRADYVQDTLTVTVNNVVPTLTATTVPQSVNEGTPLTITNIGTITDPGFDNPANPLAKPDGTTEFFHYYINSGDGTTSDLGSATVDVIGSPGTQTQASFDGVNHMYADNGVYTVTLRWPTTTWPPTTTPPSSPAALSAPTTSRTPSPSPSTTSSHAHRHHGPAVGQ